MRRSAAATLVALAIEGMATVTDEIIDLHDRILGKLFNAAKNKHQQQFQASGNAINAKVRPFGRIGQALIEASKRAAIHSPPSRPSWDAFAERHRGAEARAARDFDFLHRIGESYARFAATRRNSSSCSSYQPRPPPGRARCHRVLRGMSSDNARKVPTDAPTDFIKPRWQKLVMTDAGIDRRYYGCARCRK